MSRPDSRSPLAGVTVAVGVGLAVGLLIVGLALRGARFEGRDDARLAIQINGVDAQMARDVLLPNSGWVLEIELPPELSAEIRDTLQVTLRAERSGATIEIADQFVRRGDLATLVIPESLGLSAGLLSIRATLTDRDGAEIDAYRRVRIRRWLGGPPIGSREIIHFDFSVDRNEDGRPDFEVDLERFGLATSGQPELAARVSRRIAERALARVQRAYDPVDDPNHTGLPRDLVFVRFQLEADPGPFVTRICVGGANLAHPESIGNVEFDHRNARKSSNECDPKRTVEDEPPVAAGLFPAEFTIYRKSALYREVLGPFLDSEGGTPIGRNSRDAAALASSDASETSQNLDLTDRRHAIDRAVEVFGDALGTVMAHETAHALGLVPEGKPGVGLFGGGRDQGDAYAHNLDARGNPPATPWLMNSGRGFRFEDLAGQGPSGELRFRPLNYAYLKDRVVIVDDRN